MTRRKQPTRPLAPWTGAYHPPAEDSEPEHRPEGPEDCDRPEIDSDDSYDPATGRVVVVPFRRRS